MWTGTLCQAIEYTRHQKVAIVAEQSELLYSIRQICKKQFQFGDSFKIIETPIGQSPLGWAFEAGAPYLPAIHKQILKMVQGIYTGKLIYMFKCKYLFLGGIIRKFEEDLHYLEKLKRIRNEIGESSSQLCFHSYISYWLFYLMGILLSLICFMCEVLHIFENIFN